MRRTVTVLTTLALSLVLAPVTPAHADDTVVVTGVPDDEDPWSFAVAGCAEPTSRPTAQVFYKIEPTTDPTPTGTHNWGLQAEGQLAVGPMAFTLNPTTSVWDMRVDPRTGGTSGWALAYYWSPDMPVDQYWLGQASLTLATPGWQTVDLSARSLQWRLFDYDDMTQQYEEVDSAGPATVSTFATTHGGDGTFENGGGAWLGYALGCDSSPSAVEPWYFDAMRVGAPGSVTTYDFEEVDTRALISASKTKVSRGGKVVLRGRPDPEVSNFTELPMVLQAKPKGAASFRKVGTATYRGGDVEPFPAKITVRPRKTTTYRWVIKPGSTHSGSTSPTLTVKVVQGRTAPLTGATGWQGRSLPGRPPRAALPLLDLLATVAIRR